MELTEITRIVAELDDDLSKENARVSLIQYGGDSDESFIVATQNGYLRLGVEFLKAGLAPYRNPNIQPNQIEVDLEYLITDDSDISFDYFERNETLTIKTYEKSWSDSVFISIVIAVLVLIPILAIVGLVAIIRALL